jgi:hypothetical protein
MSQDDDEDASSLPIEIKDTSLKESGSNFYPCS